MPRTISAADLLAALDEPRPSLALVDPRGPRTRIREHIAVSSPAPYAELEAAIARLVPQQNTPIVITEDDELGQAAAELLERVGYHDVRVLAGGLAGWKAAGGRTYQGTNVRSKTLGEWIHEHYATPTVHPEQVAAWQQEGRDLVIFDTRTHAEYLDHHVPGGIDSGGAAELVLRARQLAASPSTTVVVNCQGRTRGIVGAQTVINGLDGREDVWFLHNGTPQWRWADLDLAHGPDQTQLPERVIDEDLRQWARRTIEASGARIVGADDLTALLADGEASYLFDVRTEEEHHAGHPDGVLGVPGGVLLQGSDDHIAVLGATVVLVDEEDLVRAATTLQWLPYLHRGEIWVASIDDVSSVPARSHGSGAAIPADAVTVDETELAALVGQETTRVLDVRYSRDYEAAHLPGAVHARREHLIGAGTEVLADVLTGAATVLVVGADEVAAPVVVDLTARGYDARRVEPRLAQPLSTSSEPRFAGEIVDRLRPVSPSAAYDDFIRGYFEWEYSLVPSSEGDSHFAFKQTFDRLA